MGNLFKIILLLIILKTTDSFGVPVTFVIDKLPASTPIKDSLFVCGNFNNWQINQPGYALQKQLNGTYLLTVDINLDTLEYKFSRGSWMKIETNSQNQHLPNRFSVVTEPVTINVKIDNWQDLGGLGRFDYAIFYFFAAAFYGLALLFIAFRINKRNSLRFKAFLFLNLLLLIMLFGGVIYSLLNVVGKTQLAMIGQFVLFLWGPALVYYLFVFSNQKLPRHYRYYYVPAIMALIFNILRLLNLQQLNVLSNIIAFHLNIGDFIIYITGILTTLYFHAKALRYTAQHINAHKKIHPEENLLNKVFFISSIGIIVFILNVLLLFTPLNWMLLQSFDLVFITLTAVIFAQFIALWKYPEMLRIKSHSSKLTDDDLFEKKLLALMKEKKPYINPQLSVADLAELLDIKAHVLSKFINERFDKTFRDFINEYRIEEFIGIAQSDEFKNYTFLALAYEVGFNSKSTFNLAFKKATNVSPREYFRSEV
ncbi:MAG: helix-turn-helix domain-containing protein [Bacteroidales bacterium]|nr:helix-turn-helix domain-containing protein [Bacteroidales bacterium]